MNMTELNEENENGTENENEEMNETNMISLEMLMQMEIKCFQHCTRNERFLCFDLPAKCPSCLVSLCSDSMPTRFRVPPFILPPPLTVTNTRISYLPSFSLLLQPTDGDYTKFLKTTLTNTAGTKSQQQCCAEPDIGDLHIGITNSNADIFDFDANGLNKNSPKWIKIPSIVIKLEQRINAKQQEFRSNDLEALFNLEPTPSGAVHCSSFSTQFINENKTVNHQPNNATRGTITTPSQLQNSNSYINNYLNYSINSNSGAGVGAGVSGGGGSSYNVNQERLNGVLVQSYSQKWDILLESFWLKRDEHWSSTKYDEFNLNCLDFIINVLLEYGFFDVNDDAENSFLDYYSFRTEYIQEKQNDLIKNFLKQKLSRELIEPEFIKCLKYLNLLIKLKRQDYFVEQINLNPLNQ